MQKDTSKFKTPGKDLLLYFGLTFLFSWGIWLTVLLNLDFFGEKYMTYVMVGIFGPTIVSLCLSARNGGLKGIGRFLKSCFNGRIPLSILALLLLVVAYITFSHYINTFLGIPFPVTKAMQNPKMIPVILITTMLMTTLSEEFGWRGYAQPRLIQLFGKTKAGLILGAVWACWHLPAFLSADLPYQYMPFHQYIITLTVMSVFGALAYDGSNSFIVGMIIHGFLNTTFEVIPLMQFRVGGNYTAWVFFNIMLVITLIVTLLVIRKKRIKSSSNPIQNICDGKI